MSLADMLFELQDEDRYAGLGPGRQLGPELPSMPMMPMQQPAPEPRGNSGLLSLLPLLAQRGGVAGARQGGKGGGVNFAPGAGGPVGTAHDIARFLENKGFQVSGLEGWQGTGQISTGHIDNSQHYSGHAGDVTYGGGGRWDDQNAALDWAERRLNKRFGDSLTELIWQAPDHYDHLHYGTRPGG